MTTQTTLSSTKIGGEMKLHIYHEDRPWECTACFWIVAEDEFGKRQFAKPIQFEFQPVAPGSYQEPTLKFGDAMAMQFFPALQDAMIRSGFLKPKKDESIEAIKYHLEDMRKLVFK